MISLHQGQGLAVTPLRRQLQVRAVFRKQRLDQHLPGSSSSLPDPSPFSMGKKLVKRQQLEISTSLISSGLPFLQTCSPRNESHSKRKGYDAANFGEGNTGSKSNFLGQSHCVSLSLCLGYRCLSKCCPDSWSDVRMRKGKRQRANFWFHFHLLNICFICTMASFFKGTKNLEKQDPGTTAIPQDGGMSALHKGKPTQNMQPKIRRHKQPQTPAQHHVAGSKAEPCR